MSENIKIPQYRQLYEVLRKQITGGVFKEGDLLPSENDLCSQHNLTRPTVRHALDSLLNEGLIKKQKGKGSIVSSLPKGIGILSISGMTSAVGRNSLSTRILAKPKVVKWPQPFMFELSEVEQQSGCIYLERLRLVDNIPLFYDVNYLPNINLPRFTSRNFENKSLFDMLRRYYQIEIKGGEQKLKAISANESIAGFLNVPVGNPVLSLERKLFTNRPGFNIFSAIVCNTSEHALYGTF
ncbi:MAG: GntR family transcriptional regulator [Bacteroidota bacterium]|nr:GntR family transcriptional regulator [Bacteroidota bacterium]